VSENEEDLKKIWKSTGRKPRGAVKNNYLSACLKVDCSPSSLENSTTGIVKGIKDFAVQSGASLLTTRWCHESHFNRE
jgi:hypothetical protein